MRSLRGLLLVAIIAIAAAVYGIYRAKRIERQANQRAVPGSVPLDTRADAKHWEWGQSANGKPAFVVNAADQKLAADSKTMELKQVELQLYMKDGLHFNRVRSPLAQFSTETHKLYAPGEAEITLDVPSSGDPTKPLTSVKAAGLNYDSETGAAVTDQPAAFTFAGGEGTCTGASYDPQTRSLHLVHNVSLNLRDKDSQGKPMKVEAGELIYSESEGVIRLGPWSRMTRDETVINAKASTIRLRENDRKEKKIDTIDAVDGKGTDKRPGRELEYSAKALHVQYTDAGEIDKMNATGNAKLTSHGKGSDTTITGDTVDLFFTPGANENELSSAIAKGKAAVESKPIPDPKGNTADTKIMKSDVLDLHMKPGGRDLDRVNTHAPGTLEFVPNQIARHRRILNASQMDIAYGAKSEIQSFHAVDARTETHPSDDDRKKKKPNLVVAYTSSKVLDAAFDDKGQLAQMKQAGDFRYTAGPRKAQAETATLESEDNVMNLDVKARIADDTGSTAGDHITLHEDTGDFDAKGHVSTTRLPDAKKASSDMLDKEEPTQGLADRVTSANRNRLIHYVGNAVLWQASNRITADRIDIDREKKMLVADGQVVSQFQDNAKEPADKSNKAAAAQPVFTIVKAQHLVYTDTDRQAVYTGGTNFWRPSLTVKSATLKAFLNDSKSDAESRINHAFADEKVEIVDSSPTRKRIGLSEHAEYYSDEGKIVLTGGEPQLRDSLKGNTTGERLTYFTDDERLEIGGTPQKQTKTHLKKKTR